MSTRAVFSVSFLAPLIVYAPPSRGVFLLSLPFQARISRYQVRAAGGDTWWYEPAALTAVGAPNAASASADYAVGAEVVLASGFETVSDARGGELNTAAAPCPMLALVVTI